MARRRGGLSLFLAVVVSCLAIPAPALAAPVFQMPFPCGERWGASTYTNHDRNGNNNSVDWNLENYAQDRGRRIEAGIAGTVTVGWQASGYGNYVTITVDGAPGWATRYAHLETVSVSNGQQVGPNTQIGTVGSTGLSDSSAYHLHYEQRYNGVPQRVAINGAQISVGTFPNQVIHTSGNCGGTSAPPPASNTYLTNADGVRVRSAPNTTSSIVKQLGSAGTQVHIVCQTTGETINGSNIWDKIDSPAVGYVADYFVNTGTTGFKSGIPRCDGAKPSGALTTPTAGSWVKKGATISVRGDFTDDVGVTKVDFFVTDDSYQWKKIGTDSHGGNGAYGISWTVDYAAGSNLHFHAHAFDAAGNHAIDSVKGVDGVRVDGGPPTGKLIRPSAGSRLEPGQTVTVSGDFSDDGALTKVDFFVTDDSYQWKQIGTDAHGGNGTYSVEWTVDYPVGANLHFHAHAHDAAGNEAIETVSGIDGVSVLPPTPIVHRRAVTLSLKGHLRALGSVSVTDNFSYCYAAGHVRLQRRNSEGQWRSVGGYIYPSADGSFSVSISRDRPGAYRAKLSYVDNAYQDNDQFHHCSGAVSKVVRHQH